jgi:hypothetical protein
MLAHLFLALKQKLEGHRRDYLVTDNINLIKSYTFYFKKFSISFMCNE